MTIVDMTHGSYEEFSRADRKRLVRDIYNRNIKLPKVERGCAENVVFHPQRSDEWFVAGINLGGNRYICRSDFLKDSPVYLGYYYGIYFLTPTFSSLGEAVEAIAERMIEPIPTLPIYAANIEKAYKIAGAKCPAVRLKTLEQYASSEIHQKEAQQEWDKRLKDSEEFWESVGGRSAIIR